MNPTPEGAFAPDLRALLAATRPRLHRYCARMVGSVIDGEDVLQDALTKAMEAAPRAGPIGNPEGWLFRIAHNTALDFLRRRNRHEALHSLQEVDMIIDEIDAVASRQIAATSLRTFMGLPVGQRASVILVDVLGCSLQETCDVMDLSLPAVKGALHRARTRLRELAEEPDDTPPPRLSPADRARLANYVDHFNARNFDAIRNMLAAEVKLDLVNKLQLKGKAEVSGYFSNYSKINDWHLVPGLVEGNPAILVLDPAAPGSKPKYFILLGWSADEIVGIRDFRHASYVTDEADIQLD